MSGLNCQEKGFSAGSLEGVLDPETIELGSSLVSKCPIDRVIGDERCLMFREISHG